MPKYNLDKLVDYIKACKRKGISVETAKQELLKAGWPVSIVNEAISRYNAEMLKQIKMPKLPKSSRTLKAIQAKPESFKARVKLYVDTYFKPIQTFSMQNKAGNTREIFINIWHSYWPLAIVIFLSFIFLNALINSMEAMFKQNIPIALPNWLISVVMFSSVIGLFVATVVSFFFFQALLFGAAKMLKGKSSFVNQCYLASLTMPFSSFVEAATMFVTLLIALLPFGAFFALFFFEIVGGIIFNALYLYLIVLNVMYIKEAHEFSWGKAIGTFLILLGFVALIVILVVAIFLGIAIKTA